MAYQVQSTHTKASEDEGHEHPIHDTKTSHFLWTTYLLLVNFAFPTFNDCTTIPKRDATMNLVKSLEGPLVSLDSSKQEDGKRGEHIS